VKVAITLLDSKSSQCLLRRVGLASEQASWAVRLTARAALLLAIKFDQNTEHRTEQKTEYLICLIPHPSAFGHREEEQANMVGTCVHENRTDGG
jgi:hypothetical protein